MQVDHPRVNEGRRSEVDNHGTADRSSIWWPLTCPDGDDTIVPHQYAAVLEYIVLVVHRHDRASEHQPSRGIEGWERLGVRALPLLYRSPESNRDNGHKNTWLVPFGHHVLSFWKP